MQQITDAVLAGAESPWIYLVVFGLTVLDAFIVVLPSETVVVALGALALSGHGPSLWIVVPVAAAAAIIGDSLTFWVGSRWLGTRLVGSRLPGTRLLSPGVGLDRFRWMSRQRVEHAFAWARTALDRRAAVVLLTARFVPFGRIAVNLAAGATGFGYRRFLALTTVAGWCWAFYNAMVGALFGAVLGGNPVLAVAVSIVVAIGLGVLVDRVSARLAKPHLQ